MTNTLTIAYLVAIITIPCLLSLRKRAADWLAAIAVAALLCASTVGTANAGEARFAILTPEMAVGVDTADLRHCGGKPSAALFMWGQITDQTCAIKREGDNIVIQFNNHEFPYEIPVNLFHKGK